MPEEKSNANESAQAENHYQAPAVEEVITRENLEREVAYAGVAPIGSGITN